MSQWTHLLLPLSLLLYAILRKSQAVRGKFTSTLSGAARQLPQRGSHWRAGSLPTGRLRFNMAQKGGPCLRGQALLGNAPCQAAAGLDSGALLFPINRASLVQAKADRHANGSPFGGAGGRKPD